MALPWGDDVVSGIIIKREASSARSWASARIEVYNRIKILDPYEYGIWSVEGGDDDKDGEYTGVNNIYIKAEMLLSHHGRSESYSIQAGWNERSVKWFSWIVDIKHFRIKIAFRSGIVAILGAKVEE